MKNKNYNLKQIIGIATGSLISGILLNLNITIPPVQENIVKETIVFCEIPVLVEKTDNENDSEVREMLLEELYFNYLDKRETMNLEDWWGNYKVIASLYEIEVPSLEDNFSQESLTYLYRCVETETFGADFESKTHVASVIFNRLKNGGYGDSLTEVITRPSQFAYHRTQISESTIEACKYVFVMGDTAQGALSFHSSFTTLKFNGQDLIFTDACGHNFYK